MSAARITRKCIDALDKVLFEYNLEFRDEGEEWDNFAADLMALVYKYYDDNGSNGASYDPDAPSTSMSMSETLSTNSSD